jgi:uncharacterized protein (TIGR03437 family)
LSRDGALVAFESRAADPKANSATNEAFQTVFIYNRAADTFTQVGPRPASNAAFGDFIRFPTFTDYNGSLQPGTLVFTSGLNFKTDGTFPAADQDSTGLNAIRRAQIFATQLPAGNSFVRLTKNPSIVSFPGLRAIVSESRQRMTFSMSDEGSLGGGNSDNSTELFYLLSPPVATEQSAALSFFTGASEIPLPEATPSPSPTPTPSPGTATGLAPGEIGIIRTTVEFVPSDQGPVAGSEINRSPALPVELNGVSVSVNGAAAGLSFVGKTSKQINFVVPLGVATGVATVVVNSRINGGTQFRGFLQIVTAQPDIFRTLPPPGPGGRALVCNVTNELVMGCLAEPFSVTSPDRNGDIVATVLQINLTGARGAVPAEVKITIGTTDITTDVLRVRPNPEMPGLDLIDFKLPASLAGAGDVPIIVTITRSGAAFSSRPADTAPHITISP